MGGASVGPVDAETARAALHAEHRDAQVRLAGLTASFDDVVAAAEVSNGDDEHDIEGTTIASTRAQITALARAARAQLHEIDAALARVDDGSYGTCVVCGGPIGDARLDARPTADRCIACASRRGDRSR